MIEIIPSVAILNGKVVRLTKGDYNNFKTYEDSPVDLATRYLDCGVKTIHLVDLNGAVNDEPQNDNIIEILKAFVPVDINFTGGIHTDGAISKAFECGANSVTIGEAAIEKNKLFSGWLMSYGREKVWLAADCIDGMIHTRGWQKNTNVNIIEHIRYFYDRGLKFAKITDIARDGVLEGPNFELYQKIVELFPDLRVYASGGVRSMDDIQQLEDIGVKGVIIGKALHEGKLNLKEIQSFCK
ncbi:1-(5-phosphoribosyl)-5-[(5-phosphoribosylamino)methylideneamino]imidazole-4-carboxamide isomerase [Aureibacter tunicatorum]|uniref:1-(5-phosphoribosyl)-5-[(5-phosphoribosylamino)methylideneamino] imidazole-4-carboxamide isomerase n=1 Tax=Aureibacter tunicatorum TaxID=866807 RepID=A0AAE3XIL1_9BACT|nr:1-(5-phosphoribosyl)-5-[(5-phosphoribosylamino)methylideneamino] imidazole-4-carboxamide isomerase [Aureibacter tunicatorum]MDR6237482.1 phosphoribosylformimino-5-aminoimidazole carboxamide ribotide isomerase [Aureibacter tunicatorum]BDD06471.1 1-(5-phosphoribosyl)-5-[(5-phosphoribosylamino) methylideneamino] imidazole-4-carboxamide isomerase [Aureibacter tunicatorum]